MFPGSFGQIDRGRFVGLVDCMVKDPSKEALLRSLLAQLSAAANQDHWSVREFFTATALEAALRSLYGEPFVPGKKGKGYVGISMSKFHNDYLKVKEWKGVRKAVLKAHERLRHRNAHPDWLVGKGGQLSDAEFDQSLLDIRLLERYYGAFILAVAGINDLDPEQVLHAP